MRPLFGVGAVILITASAPASLIDHQSKFASPSTSNIGSALDSPFNQRSSSVMTDRSIDLSRIVLHTAAGDHRFNLTSLQIDHSESEPSTATSIGSNELGTPILIIDTAHRADHSPATEPVWINMVWSFVADGESSTRFLKSESPFDGAPFQNVVVAFIPAPSAASAFAISLLLIARRRR